MTPQTVEYVGVPAVPGVVGVWNGRLRRTNIVLPPPVGHETKTQPSHQNHLSALTPLTPLVSVSPYFSPNVKIVIKLILEAQHLEPANLDLFNKKLADEEEPSASQSDKASDLPDEGWFASLPASEPSDNKMDESLDRVFVAETASQSA